MNKLFRIGFQLLALTVVFMVLAACGVEPHRDPPIDDGTADAGTPRPPLDAQLNGTWVGTETLSKCTAVVGPCREQIGEFSAKYTVNVHNTTATLHLGCPDGSMALTSSGPDYPVTGYGSGGVAEWGTASMCGAKLDCGSWTLWRFTGKMALGPDGELTMKGYGVITRCGQTTEVEWATTAHRTQ